MPLLYLFVLAVVQGLTEFLPVSSSGHLVLVHQAFNPKETASWENHIVLDVAVHVGTLFSVLLYFRKDVVQMLCGMKDFACGERNNAGTRLTGYLVLASLPVIAAGYALHIWQPAWLLKVEIVAWTTIIFGLLLWAADRVKKADKTLDHMNIKDAVLIGLAQALALIPGTSRSGVTMTASRFLGYSRPESAHFSLLLAIVAISGAGTIGLIEILQSDNLAMGLDFLIAALISFLAGYAAIAVMMKWLERSTFMPFVIYRLILGAVLLVYIYGPYAP
ncbi:MAG: undecaprenyl-diphosphate phosphatase [Alphaproteobacteria bacterium]